MERGRKPVIKVQTGEESKRYGKPKIKDKISSEGISGGSGV
jgi:hypothetical protein